MPDPVTTNPWSGNPWERDLPRETAADAERVGSVWAWAAAQAAQDQYPDSAPGEEDATSVQPADDAYASLTADWPTIAPLSSRHITIDDFSDVYAVWDKYWRNPKKADDKVHCFDFAQYQLRIDDFRGTGDGADPSTYYQLFVETFDERARVDVTDVARSAEALAYLKAQIIGGVPVMAGIRLLTYPPRPNPDHTTNHFVVIVGMGQEDDGPYDARYFFWYYDYLYKSSQKFYLYGFPTLALHAFVDDSGTGPGVALRRVSQIRPTVRR